MSDSDLDKQAVEAFLRRLPKDARNRLRRRVHGWSEEKPDLTRDRPVEVVAATGAFVVSTFFLMIACLLSTVLGWGCTVAALLLFIPTMLYSTNLTQRHTMGVYLRETCVDGRLTECPRCGYDQRGTRSDDCPECGGSLRLFEEP